MSGEKLVERVQVGLSAVVGLLAVMATLYGGAVLVWFAMREPNALALVVAAALVSAAIFFRKERNVYNVTLGHPDSAEIIARLKAVLDSDGKRSH